MNYETLSTFAQTVGLLYFVSMFGLVLFYALSPSNKSKFDKAAHLPIEEDSQS